MGGGKNALSPVPGARPVEHLFERRTPALGHGPAALVAAGPLPCLPGHYATGRAAALSIRYNGNAKQFWRIVIKGPKVRNAGPPNPWQKRTEMNDYAQYLIANIADLVIIIAGTVAACYLVAPRKKGRH